MDDNSICGCGEESCFILWISRHHLIKPFSARELLARVQLWLKIACLRKETEMAREHLHDLFMFTLPRSLHVGDTTSSDN